MRQRFVQRMVGEAYRRLAFSNGKAIPAGAIDAFSVHHRSREVVSRGLATGRRMLPELRYPFHFERVDVPTMLIWGDRDRMVSHEGAERLLAAIGELLTPCPAPDVAAGWDRCAHAEPWPCPVTRAAWLAQGLDIPAQVRPAVAEALSLIHI